MTKQGKDLFNDYQMGSPLDISPESVFIGKDHPDIGYGQTGLLLFNSVTSVFVPHDVDEHIEYPVDVDDVCRVHDLHYFYASDRYSP